MFIPIETFERAVRLVQELGELTDPADFAPTALPALAELIGCEVVTYNEVSTGPSELVYQEWPAIGIAFTGPPVGFDEVDRAVLAILRRPLLAALIRARIGAANPGAAGLSARETTVMRLVAQGKTNAAIGRTLAISPRTVAKHLEHIYGKLNVSSRAAAVARALP